VGAAVAAFNAMSGRLAELDRENRRLADAEHLSELGEVARGLAHTLRNPLNALGLAVERLAEERDDARAAELAEGCRRQIRRLDASLRSFLALASAPAAAAEPVDLATLAREVALEAAQDAAGRVRVEVDAPEPVALPGVGAELKAALQALVVNACEASPDDGRVVLRVRRDGGADDAPVERARIEVEDEGAGIAPEVAARLFAPHVTTKPHGSGMGLFLAHRLAGSRYGGSLELTARSPRGTRAVLRLARRELPRRPETAS
jgi:signal transduction histidine kinase